MNGHIENKVKELDRRIKALNLMKEELMGILLRSENRHDKCRKKDWKKCPKCGGPMSSKAKRCRTCFGKHKWGKLCYSKKKC